MTMKKYVFSEIQGSPDNDILASGTLVVDGNNQLKLHDGTTNGGNVIGSASLGDLKISGTILGTKDGSNGWGGSWLNLDPGGESWAGVSIPSNYAQEQGNDLTIYNDKVAGSRILLRTGTGNFYIGNNKIQLPEGGDIVDSNGTSVLGGGSGNSLSPYVTIVNNEVSVTAPINFAASDVPGVITVVAGNGNFDVPFYAATGDTDGNMYVIGRSRENDNYPMVYAYSPSGTVLWKQTITLSDQSYPADLNGIKCWGDSVYVTGTYNTNANNNPEQHFYVRLLKEDGSVFADKVFRTPDDTYPNVYDIEIADGDVVLGLRYGNQMQLLENVSVAGAGNHYAYFNNSNLQGFRSQSGYGGQWRLEISPGVFEPCEINSVTLPAQNLTNPSATGMTFAFRYDQNQNVYWGGYVFDDPNASAGYSTGDSMRIPGSQMLGTDGGTTLTPTHSAFNTDSGYLTAWFNVTTYPDLFDQLVSCSWTVSVDGSGSYNILSVSAPSGGLVEVVIDTPTGPATGGISFYTQNGNDATWSFNGGQLNGLTGRPSERLKATTWLASINAPDYTGSTTLNLKASLNSQAIISTPSWTKSYGIGDEGEDFYDVSYDSSNNSIYACGYFWRNDNGTYHQGAVFKIDKDTGNTTWAKYVEDDTGQCRTSSVLPDGTGNVIVIGVNNNGYTLVTKLNSDGDLIWQSRQTNNSNWNNEPRGSLDSDGNVYVVGSWYNNNNYVTSIQKLNGSIGTLEYARTFYNQENYDMYEFYNEDIQHTTVVGNNLFWAGYTYDENDNDYVGVAVRLPIDGSIAGSYGRWRIQNDSDAAWEDSTGYVNLPTANYTAYEPSTTTEETGYVSVNAGTGSAVATKFTLGGTTSGLTGVASILFADGSEQTTAAGGNAPITWTNPNNNVWRIEEYNGGAAVQYYSGDDYSAKWFDIDNHTSGSSNFRGAIIEYHAYIQNSGAIIGTIHVGNDYTQQQATHTEHMSGNSNLQYVTLWDCNNERGQLFFKMTNNQNWSAMIQWKATVFYGSENNC